MYSSIGFTRHLVCLTVVFLSLCQAFVTSSRFGMRPFLRGGAASYDGRADDHRLGPLGVLRVPPSTTRRSRHDKDGGGDEEASDNLPPSADKKATRSGVAVNGGSLSNKNVVRMPAALRNAKAAAARAARAEYVAETKLPTDVGAFQLRGYRIPGVPHGQEPCVIYARDKPPFGTDAEGAIGVPVRIHDQCLTSEVFRSQR
jgi:hypothetical protein